MRTIYLSLLLSLTMFSELQSQTKAQNILGTWYIMLQWEPPTEKNLVAFSWEIKDNHTVVLHDDSVRSIEGTWKLDTSENKVVLEFGLTTYRMNLGENEGSGTVSVGKSVGYGSASRSRSEEWDACMKKQYANIEKKPVPRLSVDAHLQPLRGGSIHFGMMSNRNLTSLNAEFFSLSVLQRGSKSYVSSNSLWLLASSLIYAVNTDAEGEHPGYFVVPLLLQVLGNFDLSVPLGTPLLRAELGQATDYYFFYAVSRVVTETRVGVGLHFDKVSLPLQVKLLYSVPWTRGYMEVRENFLTLKVGVLL